ncbi:hydrogenase 4 subunit D [Thermococcus barophilus]|uniref:Membrane bound subgroup 4b [NiFe]-hydrogenase MBH(B)3, subunit Mbh(B)3H n=1 Tax=Thermococcus barophilus TaxID=55802 RepID=A0A0S1XD15_THEBA|nr:hydrogenase 4 subunit D [Thermococcus barophilus]ALM75675.1 Membrane bound subgroup 4b [NiFe]-hydrogenase MBH(b)3, subunit Mbh(b)3H [Thermococcus barophilus]
MLQFFVLSFLIPLIAGLLLFKLDGKKADYFMLTSVVIATILNLIGVVSYYTAGMPSLHYAVFKTETFGEVYGVIVDPMSVLIGLVVITAGLLFMLYSVDYMSPKNKEHPVYEGKGRFYGWMVLFIGATLAFIYSSTILQLLIFFEIMSLACWGVVSYYGGKRAERSAYKALIVTNFGAMIGLYTAVAIGITVLHDLSLYALSNLHPLLKIVVFFAVMVAAFTKSAQFPLYSWLPDAMVAPTPASAFLHGAAMVEMGVYLLARFIQFMQPLPSAVFYIMAFLLIVTLVICVLMYPLQRDAKRLLAYSTIAESALMYVGLAFAVLGLKTGLQASMFQLFNHAYIKGLAFLTAGTFSYAIGTLEMDKIRGLIKSLPISGYGWMFALIGLAGVPPFAVFFGKLAILTNIKGALGNPLAIALLVMVLVDAGVFFMVSLKRIHEMVFSSSEERYEITPVMKLSMILLLILGIIAPLIAYPFILRVGW